ncbi:ATP-binding protein [Roseicella aquatilis]|uniref:histidine kinase n=1 Tax=Roseicella aquatilis TaxID=2527868 RepID=A0A4R4D6L7_9PROT|nr:ATP-binding protein [Roseicella aquatilis]TCZ53887.1 response regulator [Roseicella aquatilis]
MPDGLAHLAPGEYLRLSVTDDGSGMTPAVLARVTEPFFTTKPKGKGTGLGLAMARGFAEQSGGALAIESAPGRGTTVSLWLPLAGGAAESAHATEEAAAPVDDTARGAVLLVDDEPSVRAVMAAALADGGHHVAEAPDGRSALDLLEGGLCPDVLVTDLAMPGGMDGLTLVREARRLRPGLPAVLITGHTGDAIRSELEEAAGSGPFALLRKPARAEAIAAHVAAFIENR